MVVSSRSLLVNRTVDDSEPDVIPAARFVESIGDQFARGNVQRIQVTTMEGKVITLWVDY